MMSGIRVRLDGSEGAIGAVARAIERLGHSRKMFTDIGQSLLSSIANRFSRGAGPDGSPWPPSLRVLAHGGKTLIDTGNLFHRFTSRETDTSVEVGTNVIYAAIQQFGGTVRHAQREQVLHFKHNSRTGTTRFTKPNKRATFAQKVQIGAYTTKIPARPFIGLDDADEREITEIAARYVAKALEP